VIDARGAVIAPGFIDLHTHSDFTLPVYPDAPAMVRQGVTTQVVGNCGFSPFPSPADRRAELIEYTSFIDAGLAWERWEGADGYMSYLESFPLACNVAVQVGLGTVRQAVMGFAKRPATVDEMAQMKMHLVEAFESGAIGVSSGLVYAPGRFASTEEVAELVSVASAYGAFYSSHIRNEAGALVEAVEEALLIARSSGIPLQLSHHKALGPANWGRVEMTLSLIDEACARGEDVLADQYPYRAGSTAFTQILPGWVLENGVAGMRAAIADPQQRSRIVAALSGTDPDAIRDFDPESILLAEIPLGPNKRFEGWFLVDVAAELGESPIDSALRLIHDEGTGILMVVFGMSEDDVRMVMAHPAVAIASDGWTLSPSSGGNPHPRSYGTYARVLGKYTREEHVLSLEAAVHKMTGLPARRLRGFDRGLVATGMVADLVVFDPERVADMATFEDPHRFCEGIDHVLVAGVSVIENGVPTGAAPGRVLRREGGANPVE
jgi:N-acyl-D-amino-acid deacylase